MWHLAQQYPKAARHVVRALKRYCRQGRGKAARIVNRVVGGDVVSAGALLGAGVSTVTPAP